MLVWLYEGTDCSVYPQKNPSPDLLPGITDELALGIDYMKLDGILMKLERGDSLDGYEKRDLNRVKEITKHAFYRNIKNLQIKD